MAGIPPLPLNPPLRAIEGKPAMVEHYIGHIVKAIYSGRGGVGISPDNNTLLYLKLSEEDKKSLPMLKDVEEIWVVVELEAFLNGGRE